MMKQILLGVLLTLCVFIFCGATLRFGMNGYTVEEVNVGGHTYIVGYGPEAISVTPSAKTLLWVEKNK